MCKGHKGTVDAAYQSNWQCPKSLLIITVYKDSTLSSIGYYYHSVDVIRLPLYKIDNIKRLSLLKH